MTGKPGQQRRGIGFALPLSRSAPLARLLGMDSNGASARRWAAGVVVAHLIISILHGAAHDRAHVAMSVPANAFVFFVVLAGPLAGLALIWRAPRAGGWVVAATMAASLVFGFVNHFVFVSPDHVAHVAREWQPLFAATAGLLALTEAAGAGIGMRIARGRRQFS